MLNRTLLLIVLSLFILTGCRSKKKVAETKRTSRTEKVVVSKKPEPKTNFKKPPANAPYAEVVSTYIDNYSQIAREEMLQYGIPASITLAQGILESGAGRGELTRKANNHFGIKCHSGWTGDRVYHDDDKRGECFRKYKDPKYSFRDHSLFLTQRSRYEDLFKLKKDDYKGWARGLKKAGYATDPRYPQKLIDIVERYRLYEYDEMVLGNKANPVKPDDTKISTYTVVKGDTLYSIARRFNLTLDTLKEYNGLDSNNISVGQVLYLHSVKNQ
ncbi:glucosaminidase domain-containing protein [Aureitalea sp. L0-47]|uniref:glucosaminidase domain-containing protein n=1 Tax=Aureitalea sp. L0-47 TaxID=2816962 RepID=UPI002238412F|nr:glucosaminidase domain-containing protein [Aureitalea sp. L0-47]MCW5520243.1 glucosaminidase domain-containing protein [Aureitalea sp. L0-47]